MAHAENMTFMGMNSIPDTDNLEKLDIGASPDVTDDILGSGEEYRFSAEGDCYIKFGFTGDPTATTDDLEFFKDVPEIMRIPEGSGPDGTGVKLSVLQRNGDTGKFTIAKMVRRVM